MRSPRISRDLAAEVESLRIPGIFLKAHLNEPEGDGQVFVFFSLLCPAYPIKRLTHPVMIRNGTAARVLPQGTRALHRPGASFEL